MWAFPQPVQAHVQTTQTFPADLVAQQTPADDGAGILRIHEQEIEPANDVHNSPILTDSYKHKERPVVKTALSGIHSGRNYSTEEVKVIIISYSEQYGINSDTPLCIAQKESGYNAHSKNKSSSASGVFQYLPSTWRATDEGKSELDVFDADANVKAAIKYMASRKNAKPWTTAKFCPTLSFITK